MRYTLIRPALLFVVSAVLTLAATGHASAQRAELVTGGLSKPVDFAVDPTDKNRFFIVQQTGQIRIVERGTLLEEPFLDIRSGNFTDRGWEQGLLGMAFDPDYARNRRFYVNYTDRRGHTHIARFVVETPLKADRDSEVQIMLIEQPWANHNGGCLRFGPDNMLWIGTGDGGSAGDPRGYSQNLGSLLGKMLRIDVTSTPDEGKAYAVPKDNPFIGREDVLPEIWSYGLRNPWKHEFDSKGRMWIADVGQNRWEWVHLQPADSKGGENYGWNIMEGPEPFGRRARAPRQGEGEDASPQTENFVKPVWSYRHAPNASITGGFFYEGTRVRALRERYIFADFMMGKIWSIQLSRNNTGYALSDHTDSLGAAMGGQRALQLAISSFGRDADGELYILDHKGGRLFKIVP